jgi:hypothetical protein
MKTLFIITSLVSLVSTQIWGQNYIGMSQSKIIRNYGNPDEKGDNYITYQDRTEDGTNKYYFDNAHKCTSFVLTRDVKYFEDYVKLLEKEFQKSNSRKYINKSKNYQAEIVESNHEFQVKISFSNEPVSQADNKTANLQGKNDGSYQ